MKREPIRKVKIKVSAIQEKGLVGVRRALAFLALGHSAWTNDKLKSVVIPDQLLFQYSSSFPGTIPDDVAAEIRKNFRQWVIGNAFLEIERNLSLFADEVFVCLLMISLGTGLTNEAKRRVRQFKSKSLREKFEVISDEFPISHPTLKFAGGWSSARNCLAHANGIVRTGDCLPGSDVLRLCWQQVQIFVEGEQLAKEKLPFHIKEGERVDIHIAKTEREYRVSTPILLSEQDVHEICMTTERLVLGVVDRFIAYAKSKTPILP